LNNDENDGNEEEQLEMEALDNGMEIEKDGNGEDDPLEMNNENDGNEEVGEEQQLVFYFLTYKYLIKII